MVTGSLLIVFVVVLGVVFVNMGQWQLDRLAGERRERNATTIANERSPIWPYERIFSHPITDADQWQRVEARAPSTRPSAPRALPERGHLDGYEVDTLAHGERRCAGGSRTYPAATGSSDPIGGAGAATGEVTIIGHVRRNEKGRRAATTPVGNQMRLINPMPSPGRIRSSPDTSAC